MNDRELLEMAAKAAGIKARWFKVNQFRQVGGHRMQAGQEDVFGTHHRKPWNPLDDDGDALRLAVKLRIRIWGPGHAETPDGRPCVEGESVDENANTRRAITRAAAEIGKAM